MAAAEAGLATGLLRGCGGRSTLAHSVDYVWASIPDCQTVYHVGKKYDFFLTLAKMKIGRRKKRVKIQ